MRLTWTSLLLLFLLGVFAACGVDKPPEVAEAEEKLPEQIDFNTHVRPVFSDRCFTCHGPDKNSRKAGLRLDTKKGAFAELTESPGKYAIVPGELSKSELYHRITAEDPEKQMPPQKSNLELTAREKAILTKWIEQGAEWKPFWSFIPPGKPEPPEVDSSGWTKNNIDRFVLARLQREGLNPQPQADREMLIRRVTFDLTGLPPTVEEINAFLSDDAPDAYEKVVDRLLSSPRYGERMAVQWMDLARYADTHGYTVDRYRDMSPWRDWVIEAFNENMPYDQFVTWQLAGDLLPSPTRNQRLATAFNRLHQQNAEGGIVNEEYRVEYVSERTETFGSAFLGLTVECARCHDHKYDPIEQEEYFQLSSFFDNIDEAGQISWDNAMPVPTMLLPEEKVEKQLAFVRRQEKAAARKKDSLEAKKSTLFEGWLASKRATKSLSHDMPAGLVAHYPLNRVQSENIPNRTDPDKTGIMIDPVTGNVSTTEAEAVDGKKGQGLKLDGDHALYLPEAGIYDRAEPFSVGMWIKVPRGLEQGVIFHKNDGGRLYNYRGYYVSVKDDRFHLVLAHTFPYNAIHLTSKAEVPRGQWIHVMMTYDGSSKAAGTKLYVNGKLAPTQVKRDNLYKDILLRRGEDEPGLKVGARKRSKGFTNGQVDEVTVFDRSLTALEAAQVAGRESVAKLAAQQPDQLSESQRQQLHDYYLVRASDSYAEVSKKLEELRAKEKKIAESIQEVMVMDEMEEPRQTYLLERGEYSQRGKEVEPGTPSHVMSFPDSLEENRLGLAKWLTHSKNPLFARVAVNRLWHQLFGRGLVATPGDFGNQGELPTHPELLDWLAVTFRESGWDVKTMLKKMVMSAAYKQSSHAPPALREQDPENRLLARGPSRRLTAEMMRDQALAVSGLLVDSIGGPSVRPYQPDGLWEINGGIYEQGTGDALYRRSLYTFWKRTVPPPTMDIFDAPARSHHVPRRQKTSTPLQSLALMNDPQFVEAARVTAERVLKEGGSAVDDQLTYAFRLLTSRTPRPEELNVLRKLYEENLALFTEEPTKADELLTAGERPVDGDLPPGKLASYATVINTIMSYDAATMRR